MVVLRSRGGFTLVEVSIIVLTLAVLSAILVPNLGRLNELARQTRVREDLQTLCVALKTMIDDVGESALYIDGGGLISADNGDMFDANRSKPNTTSPIRENNMGVGLLIGDGDIPDSNGAASTDNWRLVFRDVFDEKSDGASVSIDFWVDTFTNQLIQNIPLGPDEVSTGVFEAFPYRTPSMMEDGGTSGGLSLIPDGLQYDPEAGQAFNSLQAWRGPYLNDRVHPDPWGNRYMANTFALFRSQEDAGDGYGSGVVCYSAGPDEEIDTDFNQPDGWTTGDDDLTVALNRMR